MGNEPGTFFFQIRVHSGYGGVFYRIGKYLEVSLYRREIRRGLLCATVRSLPDHLGASLRGDGNGRWPGQSAEHGVVLRYSGAEGFQVALFQTRYLCGQLSVDDVLHGGQRLADLVLCGNDKGPVPGIEHR